MPRPVDILHVMARVADSPGEDLSTEALARTSGWSSAHFHRAFARTARLTPKAWTTRLRLVHAVEQLCTTDRPIPEIAVDCGFSSHAQLARVLRRCFDTTPTAIRGMGGADHVRHALCLTLYHLSLEPRSAPMPTEVVRQDRPAQPVVFMRRTVPMDQIQAFLAECLPATFMHCQQKGLTMAGPPYSRYVGMTPGSLTIEAGIPVVSAEGNDEQGIIAGELPGGSTLVLIHTGPYDTLNLAHSALETEAKAQGLTPSGGPWESYLTDPGEVPDPADWKTEVCLPVG